MSIVDKLKKLQDVRQNKYSQALQKSPVELAENALSAQTSPSEILLPLFTAQSRLLKGILALLVVLTLEVGFIIVFFLKNPPVVLKKAQLTSPEALLQTEVKALPKTETKTSPKSTKVNKTSFKESTK